MQQNMIILILSFLGCISLLLFGVKIMSEGLQKVAAMRLRRILAIFTSGKLKSVVTGFTITSLLQSSSVTTVMIVSFVHAGLIGLTESVAVVMGSNIGAGVIAWLIFVFGIELNAFIIALPMIALAFPFIFSNENNRQQWGKFLMGFALILLSLDFLKNLVPDISANPIVLDLFSSLVDNGFISILTFFILGALITALVQSSGTVLALTLVMATKGWLNLELATAVILGINLGTTITANLAAVFANTSARITARSHFVFNALGMLWVLILFKPVLLFISYLTDQVNGLLPMTDSQSLPLSMALFHTLFNLVNTLLFVPFIPLIIGLSKRLVKQSTTGEESFTLKYFNTGILSTPELSIGQARKKMAMYAKETMRMFNMVRGLFQETNNPRFDEIYYHIRDYEKMCDKYEIEIAQYLSQLSEKASNRPGSKNIRAMLKMVDDLESIADECNYIAKLLYRKKKGKIWFTQDQRNHIHEMFSLVEQALREMNSNLNKDSQQVNTAEAKMIEKTINKFWKKLHNEHIKNLEAQTYNYQAGRIYTDLFSSCEKLGNHVMNVTETMGESIKKS